MIIGGGRPGPAASTRSRRPRSSTSASRHPTYVAGPAARHQEDVRERGDPARLDGVRDRRRVDDDQQRQPPGVQQPDLRPEDRRPGSKVATPTVPRVYHSSALLLPDGRVATFGGNPEDGLRDAHRDLHAAVPADGHHARPTITSAPDRDPLRRDRTRSRTTQASAIALRGAGPARGGHPLERPQPAARRPSASPPTASGVSVQVTNEPNLAPPGWYMLFVVDGNGVPSVAKWVHLTLTGRRARPSPAPRVWVRTISTSASPARNTIAIHPSVRTCQKNVGHSNVAGRWACHCFARDVRTAHPRAQRPARGSAAPASAAAAARAAPPPRGLRPPTA